LAIALFIAYAIFFSWLLGKIPFVKRAGLPMPYLIALFVLKIAAGLAYGYIHFNAPGHVGLTDTWKFFYQGSEETAKILKDPYMIIRDILPHEVHRGFGKLFTTENSYWNDVKHELMVKLAAVLNIFSGSNYYVNVVLYSFMTMAGPVAMYRLLQNAIPGKQLRFFLACCIPTVLFWCSGFHKEGILFNVLALIWYMIQRKQEGMSLRLVHYFVLAISVLSILLLRNNIVLPLAPALLGFFIAKRFPDHRWKVYGTVCLLGGIAFFLSPYLGVDLPAAVSHRQQEFIALGGRTAVAVTPLEANLPSFFHHLPVALSIGFLRPLPLEGGVQYLPFSLEALAFLLLLIFTVWTARRHQAPALVPALLVFGMLNWLMIGYTVPNIGAVIRYRSITSPFLFSALFIWLHAGPKITNNRIT
jgi:hypothetical protein